MTELESKILDALTAAAAVIPNPLAAAAVQGALTIARTVLDSVGQNDPGPAIRAAYDAALAEVVKLDITREIQRGGP